VLSLFVGFNSAIENGETKCKERERRALLKFKQSLQDGKTVQMQIAANGSYNVALCLHPTKII
jgi:hypothetical protein